MDKTFGKYLIETKLGQGGMGAVYLALDPSLNHKVALKVIASNDTELLERFQREAQAAAKLKHPNIIQVYESGVINNQHYFTMDYIDGISLDNMVTSTQRPSVQYVSRVIMQIALALDYAHSQGVIHRDIKPANIMIDKNDKIFLTDFGLTKRTTGVDKPAGSPGAPQSLPLRGADRGKTLNVTGSIVGTPDYMPPEQAMGQKGAIDRRSDIYSLGATLYHCLTGKPPFQGKELRDVLSKIINDEPAPPSTIVSIKDKRLISKDLENICLKCLQKDKAKRYQTAGELAADLQNYLQRKSVGTKKTAVLGWLWAKVMQKRTAFIAIAAAAVVLIAVLINWLATSFSSAGKLEKYRQEARSYFDQGRYEDARVICEKILALAPSADDARSLLESCDNAIKQKELATKTTATRTSIREKAQKILERLNKSMPPDSRIQIAQAAVAADNAFGQAYQALAEAYRDKAQSAKDGRSPDAYWELIDKAYDNFAKAIQFAPELAYSYYERALITAYIRNKPEEAIPDFEKVLQYDPAGHLGWFAKGNIEYSRQKYDEAIKSFTRAIELYPDYVRAYNNRAAAYFKSGAAAAESRLFRDATDKAMDGYNKAIKIDPSDAASYNNRGKTYSEMGELDKALVDLTEAIKLNPAMIEAYTNRAITYGKKSVGEPDADARQSILNKALADYTEAIRLNPKSAGAYLDRGGFYDTKGQIDQAISDYTEAIRLDPKNPAAYSNRCVAYYNTGKYKEALADGETFLKLVHSESSESTPNHEVAPAIKQIVETCKKKAK